MVAQHRSCAAGLRNILQTMYHRIAVVRRHGHHIGRITVVAIVAHDAAEVVGARARRSEGQRIRRVAGISRTAGDVGIRARAIRLVAALPLVLHVVLTLGFEAYLYSHIHLSLYRRSGLRGNIFRRVVRHGNRTAHLALDEIRILHRLDGIGALVAYVPRQFAAGSVLRVTRCHSVLIELVRSVHLTSAQRDRRHRAVLLCARNGVHRRGVANNDGAGGRFTTAVMSRRSNGCRTRSYSRHYARTIHRSHTFCATCPSNRLIQCPRRRYRWRNGQCLSLVQGLTGMIQ